MLRLSRRSLSTQSPKRHRTANCGALLTTLSIALTLTGCRMGVPIHVWEPPQIESTVGQQVIVPTIDEHRTDLVELAFGARQASATDGADSDKPSDGAAIHDQLISQAPSDGGRNTTLISPDALNSYSDIQLVSAIDNQRSDVALASLARRQGIGYLLRGEVLPDRRPEFLREKKPQLSTSWRLMKLNTADASPAELQPVEAKHQPRWIGGQPIVIDLETAIKRYPDLAIATDSQTALQSAVARETLRLITPTVQRDRIQLEISYLMPGSRETRRGNLLARSGRWAEAKAAWQLVVEKNPLSVAALHNLAIAAAAEQDFSTAKLLARKAIRRNPSKLHKRTLVWIERRQRDYHKAFQLPDPPEGWFVTGG